MAPRKKPSLDLSWDPKVGDLIWTRFDKSNARTLGIVLRQPPNPPAVSTAAPSVYCELDLPDRFAIACLDGESHVYPPVYYLKPFEKESALALRCMKVKSSKELSPWDREKRKAIKGALKCLEMSKNSLEEYHNFRECPECCDEADEKFWEIMGLKRGDANIKRKDSLEKRRAQIRDEVSERDRLLKEREEATKKKKAARVKKNAEEESTNSESGGSDSGQEQNDRESPDDDSADSADDDEDDSSSSSGPAEDDDESEVAINSEESEVDEMSDTGPEESVKAPAKPQRKKRTKRGRQLNLDSSANVTEDEEEQAPPAPPATAASKPPRKRRK